MATQVTHWDVGIVGIPFDGGTSYRPGARFGPAAVRQASRLLRPYHPAADALPFALAQVVDAGDIACTPFSTEEAVTQIQAGADALLAQGAHLVAVGGDHTIALPLLRATSARHGPLALVHFDAHLDTWDTYFGQRYTHGTPFRRAWEEGLLAARPQHARGPARAALRPERPDRRHRDGLCPGHHRRRRRGRRGRHRRADAGPGGRRAALRLGRHRRARPSARPGHRHPRGGWPDQPRAPRARPRPRGGRRSWGPTWWRSRRPTTMRRSPRSRPPTCSTSW